MKRLPVLLLLFLPIICIAQKTNFSGKWNLNLQKTDFKRAPDWLMPKSFEITQKNDALVIEAKVYDKEGIQHYYTETLSFNGTTKETIIYAEYKRVVSMRWNDDNKSFVLSVRLINENEDNPSSSDFTETWSLENDGKTLVVDREATQANEYSVRAYYDKK